MDDKPMDLRKTNTNLCNKLRLTQTNKKGILRTVEMKILRTIAGKTQG